MKLTPELKERIDKFFDNISAEELFEMSVNEYGFIEVEGNNMDDLITVKRGCTNEQCFCTGKCEEIIGFEKKTRIWDKNGIYPIRKKITPMDKWSDKICKSPSHQPPSHLYIPAGEIHIHKCNSCGQEFTMMGSSVWMNY